MRKFNVDDIVCFVDCNKVLGSVLGYYNEAMVIVSLNSYTPDGERGAVYYEGVLELAPEEIRK